MAIDGIQLMRFNCFACIILLLLLTACGEQSTQSTEPSSEGITQEGAAQDSDEAIVTRRAEERWQALIAGDWQAAYSYLSPGMRDVTPFDLFEKRRSGRRAVRWIDAKVDSLECESARCNLDVKVTTIYQGSIETMVGQESSSILREKWLLSDGQWWYVAD